MSSPTSSSSLPPPAPPPEVISLRRSGLLGEEEGQPYDYLVIIDFEATCEEDKNHQDPQEIIEFPAVVLDTRSLETIAQFQRYVRPVLRPKLSDFCTKLTGITQEKVEEAEVFEVVLKEFVDWMNSLGLVVGEEGEESVKEGERKQYCFVTHGDWDLKEMLPKQWGHSFSIPSSNSPSLSSPPSSPSPSPTPTPNPTTTNNNTPTPMEVIDDPPPPVYTKSIPQQFREWVNINNVFDFAYLVPRGAVHWERGGLFGLLGFFGLPHSGLLLLLKHRKNSKTNGKTLSKGWESRECLLFLSKRRSSKE